MSLLLPSQFPRWRQNAAARLILFIPTWYQVSPLLKTLQWCQGSLSTKARTISMTLAAPTCWPLASCPPHLFFCSHHADSSHRLGCSPSWLCAHPKLSSSLIRMCGSPPPSHLPPSAFIVVHPTIHLTLSRRLWSHTRQLGITDTELLSASFAVAWSIRKTQ